MPPPDDAVRACVEWIRLIVEATGALIVSLGFVVSLATLIRVQVKERTAEFTRVRLILARYLALALEFQLAADILSTSISPTWERIGRLAAIAIIRTGLNYFLSKEMKEERKGIIESNSGGTAPPPDKS